MRRPGIFGPYPHGDRWRLRIRGADGGETWQSFETREIAERVRDLALVEAGRAAATVGEAVTAYVAHVERVRGARASTVAALRGALTRFHAPALADDLREITPSRALGLYRAFAAGRSPTTHRQRLSEVRGLWRWIAGEGWIARSPFDAVKGEGRRRRGKPQLSRDEARRVLAVCIAAGPEPQAVAVLIALVCGLRSSEICGLRVRDLDAGGTVLRVASTGGKTDAARRSVDVPGAADGIPLRDALARLAAGRAADAPLLPASRKRPHQRSWVWRAVRRYCEVAGVVPVPPHGLRGTISTLLQVGGVPVDAVATLLGHAGTATTTGHYTDREAVARADRRRGLRVLAGGLTGAAVPTRTDGDDGDGSHDGE